MSLARLGCTRFTSIGDEPLTTPIAPGEDERAGRWRGSTKMECGIHICPTADEDFDP